MMNRRPTASGSPQHRGSVVLELLMALPVMVLTMDLVVRLTFDAAFMTGLSLAAMEAAREGSQVFPAAVPFVEPSGRAGHAVQHGHAISDRIANVVNQRLRILRLQVRPTNDPQQSRSTGVRLIVRRGDETVDLGDPEIAVRELSTSRFDDEIEVVIAVRMASLDAGSPSTASVSPSTRSWVFPDVVQSSARLPME